MSNLSIKVVFTGFARRAFLQFFILFFFGISWHMLWSRLILKPCEGPLWISLEGTKVRGRVGAVGSGHTTGNPWQWYSRLIPRGFDIFLGSRAVGYGTVYLWLYFWLEFLPNWIVVMRVRLKRHCGLVRICSSPGLTYLIAAITMKASD